MNLRDLFMVSCLGGGGSGGVTSVQPDWNQNDSTKPDYVKNRPFWTDDPVETVLIEEQTIGGFANMQDSLYGVQLTSLISLTVGQVYTVSWDGTDYDCECVDFLGDGSLLVIGNTNYLEGVNGGAIPFALVVEASQGTAALATESTADTHTISITTVTRVSHKIDEKYLPDTVFVSDYAKYAVAVVDFPTIMRDFGLDRYGYVMGTEINETIPMNSETWAHLIDLFDKIREDMLCVQNGIPLRILNATNRDIHITAHTITTSGAGKFKVHEYSLEFYYSSDASTVRITRTVARSTEF